MSNVITATMKNIGSFFTSSSDENVPSEDNNSERPTRTRTRGASEAVEPDNTKMAEVRYNGQPLNEMRVGEIKAALDKLGVAYKKADKKAIVEDLLRKTLISHEHVGPNHGKRGRSVPAPASASKAAAVLRGKSSPPVTDHSLRSAGYRLRSRDSSQPRGPHGAISHLAEVSAGHLKATAATAALNAPPYEEPGTGMVFYSALGAVRSPSVSSRARSTRTARSSQAGTVSSDDEDGHDGQDTVVKVRKPRAETPKTEPKKTRASPRTELAKQTKASAKKAPAVPTVEEEPSESESASDSEGASSRERSPAKSSSVGASEAAQEQADEQTQHMTEDPDLTQELPQEQTQQDQNEDIESASENDHEQDSQSDRDERRESALDAHTFYDAADGGPDDQDENNDNEGSEPMETDDQASSEADPQSQDDASQEEEGDVVQGCAPNPDGAMQIADEEYIDSNSEAEAEGSDREHEDVHADTGDASEEEEEAEASEAEGDDEGVDSDSENEGIPSEVDEENGQEIDIEADDSAEEEEQEEEEGDEEEVDLEEDNSQGDSQDEGEQFDGSEAGSEANEVSGDDEMVVILDSDEEDDSEQGSEQDSEGDSQEGSEEGSEEGSDDEEEDEEENSDYDSQEEEEEEDEEWPFTAPGGPNNVVDLMDSSSDSEQDGDAPAVPFPEFTFSAPTPSSKPTTAKPKFEFKLPAGVAVVAPAPPVVFTYPSTLSDPTKNSFSFDSLPKVPAGSKVGVVKGDAPAKTPALAPFTFAPKLPVVAPVHDKPFVFGNNTEPVKFNGFGGAPAPAPVATPTTGGFNFGTPAPFTFGPAPAAPAPATGGFNFGAPAPAPAPAAGGGFTFGTTNVASAAPAATPTPAAAAVPTNIWSTASINSGVKCPVCLSKNATGATKCASCESPIVAAPAAAAKPVVPAVTVPAPVPAPAADLNPAVAAFNKLSQSFVSVFANNLTNAKKEKLSVEEYSLLKSLLESSKPAEIPDTPAKAAPAPAVAVRVAAPVVAVPEPKSAVKSPLPALDTTLPSPTAEKEKVPSAPATAEKGASPQDKENKAENKGKSISFGAQDTNIPNRQSYDGTWNSRESFLPSPPSTPAVRFAEDTKQADRLSGQLFSEFQGGRMAHRLPTPYHAAKRNAFSAGWTGGSEAGQIEDDAFSSLPPSKRQSLDGGYRSLQYRQQTPGAAYVNSNRLSVGSGILSDTPDASWSGGSNLRTAAARNSISGYAGTAPPSFNLNQAGSFSVGRGSYTPSFRNNAARFTPQSGAPVQTPAEGPLSESRLTRLPVSNTSRASLGGAAAGNISSTLSYIQRRKLQLKSDNVQSTAVAKKILETLNGLSTPVEEQRAKPLAISWNGEVEKSAETKSALTVATPQPTWKTSTKPHTVSFKDNSSPEPSAKPASGAKQPSTPYPMAKMDSPFVHSSIRQKPEPAPVSALKSAINAHAASNAAASDEEFTFESPMEVSGVEDQYIESVDRATGAVKRTLANAGDSTVKYIFSPPGKAQKIVASAAPSTAKPAATSAPPACAPAATAPASVVSSGNDIWSNKNINSGVKCHVCLSKNAAGATKCASCESPIVAAPAAAAKPSTASAPAAAAPASSGTGIWASSSINAGVKCKTCLSKNAVGATKCASCESPLGDAPTPAPAASDKPAAAFGGFGAAPASTAAPGAIGAGGFTFGGAKTESTKPAGISFGSAPAASTTAPAAKEGGGFTFGTAVSTTTATPASDASKTATFGFAPAAPVSAATFKPTAFPAIPAAEEPKSASKPAFTGFGNSSVAAPAAPAAAVSFGSTATTPAPSSISFGSAHAAVIAPASSTGFAASTPSFGFSAKRSAHDEGEADKTDEQPSRKRKEDTPSASFGSLGSTAAPAPFKSSTPSFGAFPALPAGVTFGDAPKDTTAPAPATGGFSGFGAKAAPPAATGGFGFGAPAPAPATFGAPAAKPVEEKKVEAPFSAPAPASTGGFGFGAAATPAAAASSANPTGFTFGAPAASTTAGTLPSLPSFGSLPTASDKVPPVLSFGSAAAAPAADKPAGFGFGAAPAAASGDKPAPFTFGATPAAGAGAAAEPFKFGASSAAPKPAGVALPAVPAFVGPGNPNLSFNQKPLSTTSSDAAAVLDPFGTPAAAVDKPAPFTFGGAPAAITKSESSTFLFGSSGSAATAGKPPLASNNSFGGAATFPGVAAVDSRLGGNNGTVTPLPAFGSPSAISVDSPGSTMDTGSFSNHSAPASNPFGGAPAAAAAGNPFSSSFGAPAAAPLGGASAPFTFGGASAAAPSSSFSFGGGSNAAPAAGGAFGAPSAAANPFGGAPAAGAPFGGAAFGGSSTALSSLPASQSFGGSVAPGGGIGGAPAPFPNSNSGVFGSSGSLSTLGNHSAGPGMGMGFGQQAGAAPGGAGGAFALGAAEKKAGIEGRRKVKVKGRP